MFALKNVHFLIDIAINQSTMADMLKANLNIMGNLQLFLHTFVPEILGKCRKHTQLH